MQQRGEINLHLVLTIFLCIGMVLFGVLSIAAYSTNATTNANLATSNAAAAQAAATSQKHADTVANTKANELPYQTYTADPLFGSFQLQFPKSWSVYSEENGSNGTALDIIADPAIVSVNDDQNAINTHQFELQLVSESLTQVNQGYAENLKNGTLASKATTVSGIPATWYQGAIDNQRHTGVAITMQVRDKVMIITTDTLDYLSEFQTILSTAKISP
jgi:hypothetical protein